MLVRPWFDCDLHPRYRSSIVILELPILVVVVLLFRAIARFLAKAIEFLILPGGKANLLAKASKSTFSSKIGVVLLLSLLLLPPPPRPLPPSSLVSLLIIS